ncbi:fungal-specific transcription factor domain-containing protein [Xylogone sp. PMI_703]|nr:fungal-specific transcription factor domain-containing protein [Xylogone sp. PMI_703]
MFTTFVSVPRNTASDQQAASSNTTAATGPTNSSRPKRIQVARACDWCRVHRIKCDSGYPCRNCQRRGGDCSKDGSRKTQTLPDAVREIERLRGRIRELEERLETPNHSISHLSSTPDTTRIQEGPSKFWQGIHTPTAQSDRSQWYGPSSSFYFIGRMKAYLATVLEQPHSDPPMQLDSASNVFPSIMSLQQTNSKPEGSPISASLLTNGTYLTGTQEDYFLGLFWQSYHSTIQIVDETAFREHYRSLWQTSSPSRKPSALVDIILALCMQYGLAFATRTNDGMEPILDVDNGDASIAGRQYYLRSQMLLTSELESPSIMTLQCHIFSVVYLCNASFLNMAHSTLALAVRTGHILGLHLEPPDDMPRAERELRKRLWWTLFAIETKHCMKLGRPWCTPISKAICQLPADDRELSLLSGSNFASYGNNVTWLTYNLLNTKLLLAARDVYVAFFDKYADILAVNDGMIPYEDSRPLEDCAQYMISQMDALHLWRREVPHAMKTMRKNSGEPLSVDRSDLDVELFAPLWLQRQRLLLELLYHNLCMNLYRPFICFPPMATTNTIAPFSTPLSLPSSMSISRSESMPLTVGHALSCVNHAIAITHIMHQILTSTNILSSWLEAFQWQWNATLTIIGFILAYPVSPFTPLARNAIDYAIIVFENFGSTFAVAASAANVTRDLVATADFLIDRFRPRLTSSTPPPHSSPDYQEAVNLNTINQVILPSDDPPSTMLQAANDTIDLAFSIDSWNGFDQLYTETDLRNVWNLTQE